VIFVDSSFWIALRNDRDAHHDQAGALAVASVREQLVTTNHVCGETWTYLRRRIDHRSAVGFLQALEKATRLRVVHVSEGQESEAWRWLRRHDERRYSFVDATSFALMRSLKIREALAFDGDFAAAGFVELRP
jgi:predicted nucleic acid-binding protein